MGDRILCIFGGTKIEFVATNTNQIKMPEDENKIKRLKPTVVVDGDGPLSFWTNIKVVCGVCDEAMSWNDFFHFHPCEGKDKDVHYGEMMNQLMEKRGNRK